MQNYKHWYAHGETWEIVSLGRKHHQHRDTDRMVDMVMDATDPEFDWGMSDDLEADSDNFFCMLKDTDEPLWPGYKIHTILSIVS